MSFGGNSKISENREEQRKIGQNRSRKTRVMRGGKMETGGIHIVFGPKYRPLE
jgi:hypothetical protein